MLLYSNTVVCLTSIQSINLYHPPIGQTCNELRSACRWTRGRRLAGSACRWGWPCTWSPQGSSNWPGTVSRITVVVPRLTKWHLVLNLGDRPHHYVCLYAYTYLVMSAWPRDTDKQGRHQKARSVDHCWTIEAGVTSKHPQVSGLFGQKTTSRNVVLRILIPKRDDRLSGAWIDWSLRRLQATVCSSKWKTRRPQRCKWLEMPATSRHIPGHVRHVEISVSNDLFCFFHFFHVSSFI